MRDHESEELDLKTIRQLLGKKERVRATDLAEESGYATCGNDHG